MRKAFWSILVAVVVAVPVAAYAATTLPRPTPVAAAAWTDLSPAAPPPDGVYAAIAYDSLADLTIFLPLNATGTWAYNLTTNAWTDLHSSGQPPVLEWSAMVYDSQADRVILYGGNPMSNETWAYDHGRNTWTNLNPHNPPPARAQHSMAYDPKADRVVLFGGSPGPVCCGNFSSETWVYDYRNNTWTQMHPAASPPGRDFAALTYDPNDGLVVLFGGETAGGNRFANDTWTYDPNTDGWTNVTVGPAPRPLMAPGMVYDAAADRIVLFGGEFDNATVAGYSNDTWTMELASHSWTLIPTEPRPLARYWPNLVYDSAAKTVILVGGFWYTSLYRTPTSADTWRFDYGNGGP